MQESYNHKEIESKIQKYWEDSQLFRAPENSDKLKYYCLSMFAYPSGKLHMGHVRNYTIGDVLSRFHSLKGFNVMQPLGWDAFGLPAENAALQSKRSPSEWTRQNIAYMKQQLKGIGLAIDWSREFATCDEDYYCSQQKLFVRLFNKGTIYRKNGIVNWDPVDQTVLANEQVVDGKGWRSGATIEKKEVPMYYFKITDYAEELLNGLDSLDGWPDQVKAMQRNWIGKSKGMEISFPVGEDLSKVEIADLNVFTTRPDTIYGVTYIAISADHPIAKYAAQNNDELNKFIQKCKQGGTAEAEIATQEKLGMFCGVTVKHPLTDQEIPVWIANYVISGYGTGAVMGVPAHCQRDFEFAKKYNLPIKLVICEMNSTSSQDTDSLISKELKPTDLDCAIATEINPVNLLINSNDLNGLNYDQAFSKLEQMLKAINLGFATTTYRLRDWGISRQRYWGCPIPVIHCEHCGDLPVPEDQLPVKLPLDVIPDGSGSPLAKMPEFYNTICPNCGSDAKRETDTMDTFVDSSWYYARYASYDAKNQILDERANNWLPVDRYIGGIEHAILHLLYARFFHKCLRDLGLVNTDEPFTNLLTQGMVIAETFYRNRTDGRKDWFNPSDVTVVKDDKGLIIKAIAKSDNQPVIYAGLEKMSKSKNNGVDPQIIVDKYGADTARLFMMFAAPTDLSLEWSDNGIEGANRFIKKLWRLVYDHTKNGIAAKYISGELTSEQKKLRSQLHQTIVKVTNDIEHRQQFNTAIASIMELLNSFTKVSFNTVNGKEFAQEILESVVIMLYPIIPHVCHILWSHLSDTSTINQQSWVIADAKALESEEVEIIIQVNGKLRAKLMVTRNMDKETLQEQVLALPNVTKFIQGQNLKKVIIVPNKLVNIVV